MSSDAFAIDLASAPPRAVAARVWKEGTNSLLTSMFLAGFVGFS